MKVSELVKTLESMWETYGDLDVTMHIATDNRNVLRSDTIIVGYDQYEDGDKIDIRDFPY